MKGLEIERKFHLRRWPPEVSPDSGTPISQGYLAYEPSTVRLRRYGTDFFLTVKSGHGLVRSETEIPLGGDQFQALWPLTVGHRLEKTRAVFLWQGWRLEIDRFLGHLAPLCVVEVEFPDEASARAFTPPDFLGEELTGRPEFLNSFLVRASSPPHLPKTELA